MKYIILIALCVLVVACTDSGPVACTLDAKECPDGSVVGRIAPDCEFAECPSITPEPAGCTDDAKVCDDGSVVARVGPDCDFAPCPAEEHYCTDEMRGDVACTMDYNPVCGSGTRQVQCVRAPCPPLEFSTTYSNGCTACSDEAVEYWTMGECPESAPDDGVGMANPASVFCEEQGGTLRMEEDDAGQYGICMLEDGSECEEWAYFRGECPE